MYRTFGSIEITSTSRLSISFASDGFTLFVDVTAESQWQAAADAAAAETGCPVAVVAIGRVPCRFQRRVGGHSRNDGRAARCLSGPIGTSPGVAIPRTARKR